MKTLQVSDEVYQKLMAFVVDPFEDTADIVVARVTEIASKAKDRLSRLEARRKDREVYLEFERRSSQSSADIPRGTRIPDEQPDESIVIL
jgi:predicted CopG family antitoxin